MENQITSHSALDLILQAGIVVQFVILTLVFASVLSWAIMFQKRKLMKMVSSEDQNFLDLFWSGKTLEEISEKSESQITSPLSMMFKSGIREMRKLEAHMSSGKHTSASMENIQRALSRTMNQELEKIETHLGWLATIASATPFIGLFGTVWGIMSSFQNIGATGSASLAVVAPGISEALIATAIGLAAAIPAVVAYNHFAGKIKTIAAGMESFSQDFLNTIQRSYLLQNKGE